jgi:hypothetical protein
MELHAFSKTWLINFYEVSFDDKMTTICLIREKKGYKHEVASGAAIRSPKDESEFKVGRKIAFKRAVRDLCHKHPCFIGQSMRLLMNDPAYYKFVEASFREEYYHWRTTSPSLTIE